MNNVLIIEDNDDDICFMEKALEKFKEELSADYAQNFEQAYHFIESKIYNFIILDINLPRVNGFEILTKIKESKNNNFTPIVVFSTSTWKGDVEKAYALGANSFISKPFKFKDFISTMECIFEYWTTFNRVNSNDE